MTINATNITVSAEYSHATSEAMVRLRGDMPAYLLGDDEVVGRTTTGLNLNAEQAASLACDLLAAAEAIAAHQPAEGFGHDLLWASDESDSALAGEPA